MGVKWMEKEKGKMKKHIHDCEKCVYLFTQKIDNLLHSNRKFFRIYDVYFCIREETFILRYGNRSDYMSYNLEWLKDRILNPISIRDQNKCKMYKKAIRRAKKLRLIK